MQKKAKKRAQKKEPRPFFRTFNKTWYVQIGKRQINLGRDKDAAFARYHELIGQVEEIKATGDLTVCMVFDRFIGWCKGHREAETAAWYERHLTSFARYIGTSFKLLELREHHVVNWIDERHAESSPNTVHGAIRAVQGSMNWAVKRGLLPKSPVKNVEKPTPEPRDIVIAPEQFAEMIARATDQCERDLFTMLWDTGCRVQEIRLVEAKNFNEAERCWEFKRTKSKGKRVPRTVYLTDTALEITRRLASQHPSGPIFRNSKGEPWTRNAIRCRFRKLVQAPRHNCYRCGDTAAAFIRGPHVPKDQKSGRKRVYICDQCITKKKLAETHIRRIPQPLEGLQGLCGTSFRHTFASRALRNRVSSLTVSVMLGHSDTRMVSRVYGHLEKDPAFIREELKRATATA